MRGSSASTLCSAAHVSAPALQLCVRGAWPNQVLDYRGQTARDLNAAGFQGCVEGRQRESNTSIVLRVHRAHFESPDAPEEHKHHAGRMNGEDVGLEEVQDGVWNILYYDTLLGRFDERTKAITGAPSIRGDC